MANWITTAIGTHYTGGYPFWESGAGGKSRFDIEEALIDLHFRPIPIYVNQYSDLDPDYQTALIEGTLTGVKKGDVVFIQYQLMNRRSFIKEFIWRCKFNGAKVVSFIQDIEPWRVYTDAELTKKLQMVVMTLTIIIF
ncbi:hypothetical protein H9L19_05280 [Weissella diestrammenae]|uniref:Glucosyltransferase 3-like N-terminal domain-containing protein n=1 Tax=Weissella diestrammenae TaxID=1162633 RepID=A0A7G9T3Z6_9LACO|nr:hypothetical protein [Weissella diestrammenae]MCM0583017.1 hypothetical protein [Weissella diestrammenae]QNN74821.1 hypothetical protein H9L19_05280 [Weissella diestrammenae]